MTGVPLPLEELTEAKEWAANIEAGATIDRLGEHAVKWTLQNPKPYTFEETRL